MIGIEDVTFNIGETLASGNATLSVDVTNITASGDSIHFDVTNDNSLITNLIVTNAGTNTYIAFCRFFWYCRNSISSRR